MDREKVDCILTQGITLTMDEEYHLYETGAVAIKGDTIRAVGPQDEIMRRYAADDIVDCQGKVIMPGLINAHTHVPMTLLRGLADDLRLDVWLLGYMMPVEREFVSPEFVELGTKLACLEMIRSGITCFVDMYYFEEHVARATADIGLRGICSQTVLKFPAPDANFFEDSISSARDFIIKWKGHPLITPSIAPHAPYTCTEEILRQTTALALEFNVPLHTHIAETAVEVENSLAAYGMPVVPYVEGTGVFEAKVIAAHCVHIDELEMNMLHHNQVGVAHNPSSNLKLASGFAQTSRMVDLGINVGIGTDGPASNNDLDMFEEVRLAALLAKTVSGDPTSLPARTALTMATRMGAQAIHLGDQIGSLEAEKKADLILVDLSVLHNSPHFRRDPNHVYAQIVYAAKSTDVTDVMVNGTWLMRSRIIAGENEEELISKAQEYAKQIDTFLIQREKSVLSKLIAISNATQEESFEIQAKVRVEDPDQMKAKIEQPPIEILRRRHYHEFDSYFLFPETDQGTLRYREDEFIEATSQVSQARYRLTLIGPAREHQFPSDVVLSRSRYLAPANNSLRFYREYFKPREIVSIEKDRKRWRILYRGTEFFINLDRLDQPALGFFLEIKSRTWSKRDAEHKAQVIVELLDLLGASGERVTQDYLELARSQMDTEKLL